MFYLLDFYAFSNTKLKILWFWKIANTVGAYLMMDMAHISGLIAAFVMANPFDYCDVVTTTTHKVG